MCCIHHAPQAVDLYVLERAFISTHANSEPLVTEVMKAYKVRIVHYSTVRYSKTLLIVVLRVNSIRASWRGHARRIPLWYRPTDSVGTVCVCHSLACPSLVIGVVSWSAVHGVLPCAVLLFTLSRVLLLLKCFFRSVA